MDWFGLSSREKKEALILPLFLKFSSELAWNGWVSSLGEECKTVVCAVSYHQLVLGLLANNFVMVSEPEVSSLKPCRAKMPHAALCVCAGASAQGKKAPCRVIVLCGRVLRIPAVSRPRGGVKQSFVAFPITNWFSDY